MVSTSPDASANIIIDKVLWSYNMRREVRRVTTNLSSLINCSKIAKSPKVERMFYQSAIGNPNQLWMETLTVH